MSADLERDLERLGDALDWPPTPDLATAVATRLAEERAPRHHRPHRAERRWWRRIGVIQRRSAAVAVALLVPAAGAAAFPGARDDVLEWLGLKSVEVERVPELRPGARPASRADLGPAVTLAEAARRAGFAPVVPPRLGPPDEIRERGGVVTFLYFKRGLRLAQLRGALDRTLVRKSVAPGTGVLPVAEGVFIEGRHTYLYLRDGRAREGRTRLTGATLISERGDLLLRLEGDDLVYEEARRLISRSGS